MLMCTSVTTPQALINIRLLKGVVLLRGCSRYKGSQIFREALILVKVRLLVC